VAKKKLEFAMQREHRSTRMTWRVRAFITVILLIAVMLLIPVSAQAGKLLRVNAVPKNQIIDNDVFLTGQTPTVSGTVHGDVFIVGSDATISGEVDGSVFVIAQNLSISGQISGNLYVAVVELTQQENAQIERNLYALALSLVTEPESSIGRDLTTVAMSARLQGQTERNTTAIIGPWELFKIVRDSINRNIIGFVPNQPAFAERVSEHVLVRAGAHQRALVRTAQVTDRSVLVDWGLTALKSFLNFLIVGGLMLWIFPRQFQNWTEKIQKEPLAAAGCGAVVLVNGYLLPVLAISLLVGLLLGLIYISLSSLAWTVFWGGMGLLLTLFTLFLAVTTFLSKAIVAYLAGTFILSKVAPGALQYRILSLLLGLLIYVPLASIPYLGSFIGLVVTLLGLGAIWLSRKQASQPVKVVIETMPA